MGFAVVDVETTGVFAKRDRIVEVAIITLTEDCTVVDEYATLVNPRRDVGPTSVHGIEAGDVRDAPTFPEVAGDVASRLQGRVMVAHNARFDEDFLRAEFDRAGVAVGALTRLCTLELAYAMDPDAGGRRLPECCARAGVAAKAVHDALEDARAVARLFDAYVVRAQAERRQAVTERVDLALRFPAGPWPACPSPSGRGLRRQEAAARTSARRHYLGRLVQDLPDDDAPTANEAGYLELLDRALADRMIEPGEAEDLLAEAKRRGFTGSQVHACHHLYLRGLIRRAQQDSVVTGQERADIDTVAAMLGVSQDIVSFMLQERRESENRGSLVGRVACFTGEFSMPREEAEGRAQARGVVVTDNVTKKTDILVAADPESQSGKAEKARKYGIPIMSESQFWERLGRR